MKLLAYSVRPYEHDAVKAWSEKYGVQVDVCDAELTAESVKEAKGYDGVSVQQVADIKDEAIYKTLEEYGIKQVSSRTAGVDMFDLEVATKHNIKVTNVPRYSPNAIAEFSITLGLMLLRQVPKALKKANEQRDFRWTPDIIGREIRSLTVGVVGTGFIGFTAAQLWKGFGANVIAYDMYPKKDVEDVLTYCETPEELFKEADLITLHLPLTAESKHLVNAETLKLMKKDAIIVNTGRGGLIDTKALIAALEAGEIKAAGLDVLEDEAVYMNKVVDDAVIETVDLAKLEKMDNVVATYHLAFFTTTAVGNMVEISFDNIRNEILGEGTVNYCN